MTKKEPVVRRVKMSKPNKIRDLLDNKEVMAEFTRRARDGCTYKMLATIFECEPNAIACNPILQSIIKSEREKRKADLLAKIFEMALYGTKDTPGNMTALIFCLKNKCGWSDDGERPDEDAPDGVDFEEVA